MGGSLAGAIFYTHFSGWPLAMETAEITPLPYTELADGLLNQYVIAFETVAALVAAIVTSSKMEPEPLEAGEKTE